MKTGPATLIITLLAVVQLTAAPSFVSGPALTKDAQDRYWVDFQLSEYADVAVSVVDPRDSTVIRHLAAGLLGPNAPAPLAASSLTQHIEWDVKDDLGATVSNPSVLTARVRAGMKTKLLNMVGDNRYSFIAASPITGGPSAGSGGGIYGMAEGPDGSIFVCGTPGPIWHQHEGWPYKVIRQYGRTGDYIRTVFPFPGGLDTALISGWGLRFREDGSYVAENGSTSMPGYTKTILAPPYDPGLRLVGLDADGHLNMAQASKRLPVAVDGSMPANRTFSEVAKTPALPRSYTGSTFFTLLPNKKEALISGFFQYIGANGHVSRTPDTSFYADGQVFKVNLLTGAAVSWLRLTGVPDSVARRTAPLSGGEYYASIHGTAVDSKARVYVCERLNRRIAVYDTLANLLGSMPLIGADNITISRSGSIYATVRTQTATGSSAGSIKIVKYASFDQGATPLCTLSVTATVTNSARPTNIVVSAAADTLVWLAYHTVSVKIYRDNGNALTLHRDFSALAERTVNGYARLAVDRRNETVYINNTWYGLYKVENWNFPEAVTCSTSLKKTLYGLDMAVSPHGMLYLREGVLHAGPIKRYSTDHYHAPLNFSNTASNTLTPNIYGRFGGTTGERGLSVAADNRVAVLAGARMHVSWYSDSSASVETGGDSVIVPMVTQSGCVRVDLKGNIYVGAKTAAPGWAVPQGYVGDWAYGNSVGTILKFPASIRGGSITASAASGASKVYAIPLAPFSADRGAGGCVCRTPRFDVDPYGRIFAPNAITAEVTVADNEGNLLKKFGHYGNTDNGFTGDSTRIPLLHPISVAASEDYIYVADYANFRMLRVLMDYSLDNMPGLTRLGEEGGRGVTGKVRFSASPNPFSPVSRLTVTLPQESRIRLDVFDVTGRFITTLASDRYPSGVHRFSWNAKDLRGQRVAKGTYVYRLRAGQRELYKKVILAH